MAAAYAVNDNFRDAIKKAQKLYWNTQNMDERLNAYREGRHATGDLLAVPPTTEPIPPVSTELAPCTKKKGCGRKADSPRTPIDSHIPT
jgi:hypothetical protein